MGKFRFGLSSCGIQDLTEQDFQNFSDAGLQELELSFSADRYDVLKWKEIESRAFKYGIHLWSLHLPYGPFSKINIASKDKDIRKYTVSYWGELMKKAADIGVKIMVLHPSAEPNQEGERKQLIENAQDSLIKLADIAEQCKAVIAVENLPRTCLGRDSAEMKQLLSADSRLRMCFDTNHLLFQPLKEFISDMGERIITTHCSDYDFIDECHWLPGEGKIDWKEVVEMLEKVHYSGPLLYEVGFEENKAIGRRRLTVNDFRENHRCLINKQPVIPIGIPK